MKSYIFFSPRCKLLLSKLQGFFYFSIPNQFYQSLLLEMEKELGICIQYLEKNEFQKVQTVSKEQYDIIFPLQHVPEKSSYLRRILLPLLTDFQNCLTTTKYRISHFKSKQLNIRMPLFNTQHLNNIADDRQLRKTTLQKYIKILIMDFLTVDLTLAKTRYHGT